MRVSLNWVKRLLGIDHFPIPTRALFDRVTLRLAEIDDLEQVGVDFGGKVVVGKVLSCDQHPNADRLRVTTVDIGQGEPLPIVCGAPNVAAGQTVAVATVGAELSMPGKDGEPVSITIKKGKLRGEPSHGMICAEDELGLGDSHDGILVLDEALAAGTPLEQALPGGDEVLVVDNHNINHRPDLWGHLGWAREIAAILGIPGPTELAIDWQDEGDGFAVGIEDERCSTYCGAVLSGVNNDASPAWMQELLTAAGVRPLGLLVDVTNYIMLELGEPMHAFDRRQITGDLLRVRNAAAGETFTTLDGKAHELQAGDLLIADGERALALAGIMGGENSAVTADTDTIVLEAAIFEAASIRRTRIRTGLATDSSNRFEKSLYPVLAPAAINRAIALLTELCPDCTVHCRFSAGRTTTTTATVPFDPAALSATVGVDLPAERQWAHLAALGFTRDGEAVQVPWWRAKDVSAPIDLVEEVGRLHGYEHIEAQVPRLPAASPTANPLRVVEHRCRQLLSAQTWDEVATYGFTSEAWAEALGWPADTAIRLTHALSSDQTVLRQSLLPNLAQAVAGNRRFLERVSIYEVGKIYGQAFGLDEACRDERMVVAGCHADAHADTPFYQARDAALALLRGLGYAADYAAPASIPTAAEAGRCAELRVGDQAVGLVAELPAGLRKLAKLPEATAWFQIELEQLVTRVAKPGPHSFAEPSRFQAVDRDFTFLCPEDLNFGTLAEIARQAAKDLVRDVALAQDIFRGEGVPDGQKAVSLRVILQADDRTLSDKDLGKACNKIVKSIEHRTPAKLRA